MAMAVGSNDIKAHEGKEAGGSASQDAREAKGCRATLLRAPVVWVGQNKPEREWLNQEEIWARKETKVEAKRMMPAARKSG